MEPLKDASHLFEYERLAHYAERPGFRITELQDLADSAGALALP